MDHKEKCPFCGYDPEIITWYENEDGYDGEHAQCTNDACFFKYVKLKFPEEWNRRYNSKLCKCNKIAELHLCKCCASDYSLW